MNEWYIVRHGETTWNAERRVQGHTDVPLHDGGREQAALTGQRLPGPRVPLRPPGAPARLPPTGGV
ncbi:MAG: histidine phosphatase family protein, partial [Chloroflexi bacterium]|nr:histidine phosphatase family protein [Chloroflexota bacterium]